MPFKSRAQFDKMAWLNVPWLWDWLRDYHGNTPGLTEHHTRVEELPMTVNQDPAANADRVMRLREEAVWRSYDGLMMHLRRALSHAQQHGYDKKAAALRSMLDDMEQNHGDNGGAMSTLRRPQEPRPQDNPRHHLKQRAHLAVLQDLEGGGVVAIDYRRPALRAMGDTAEEAQAALEQKLRIYHSPGGAKQLELEGNDDE